MRFIIICILLLFLLSPISAFQAENDSNISTQIEAIGSENPVQILPVGKSIKILVRVTNNSNNSKSVDINLLPMHCVDILTKSQTIYLNSLESNYVVFELRAACTPFNLRESTLLLELQGIKIPTRLTNLLDQTNYDFVKNFLEEKSSEAEAISLLSEVDTELYSNNNIVIASITYENESGEKIREYSDEGPPAILPVFGSLQKENGSNEFIKQLLLLLGKLFLSIKAPGAIPSISYGETLEENIMPKANAGFELEFLYRYSERTDRDLKKFEKQQQNCVKDPSELELVLHAYENNCDKDKICLCQDSVSCIVTYIELKNDAYENFKTDGELELEIRARNNPLYLKNFEISCKDFKTIHTGELDTASIAWIASIDYREIENRENYFQATLQATLNNDSRLSDSDLIVMNPK